MLCGYALENVPIESVPHLREFRDKLVANRANDCATQFLAREYLQALEMHNFYLSLQKMRELVEVASRVCPSWQPTSVDTKSFRYYLKQFNILGLGRLNFLRIVHIFMDCYKFHQK